MTPLNMKSWTFCIGLVFLSQLSYFQGKKFMQYYNKIEKSEHYRKKSATMFYLFLLETEWPPEEASFTYVLLDIVKCILEIDRLILIE